MRRVTQRAGSSGSVVVQPSRELQTNGKELNFGSQDSVHLKSAACVCALPLYGFIQAGRSLFSAGVLEPIPFSKRAGSAWHALRLPTLCYRLCWL